MGTTNKKAAWQAAADLKAELLKSKGASPGKMPWRDFTWRYQDEVLSELAPKTRNQLNTVFRTAERTIRLKRLGDVTAARISRMAADLREEGKSPYTVRNYLAHLQAALRWAVDVKLLPELPAFPRAKGKRVKRGSGRQKKMKGRVVTGEEFDRMLASVEKALTPKIGKGHRKQGQSGAKPKPPAPAVVESWKHYLRGLWWSGLRLRESIDLYWDSLPEKLCVVNLDSDLPMLSIPGDCQKNGKDELWPMAPEFAELLRLTPEAERRGRVFRLLGTEATKDGSAGVVSDPDYVSRTVSKIGAAAAVKVDARQKLDPKTGEPVERVKYASAHDLRRSFGFRWSRRIFPAELRELMRHADIQTTMAYYVGLDAASTAESLWKAYRSAVGNTSGNSQPQNGREGFQETTQAPVSQGLAKYTPLDSNQ